MNTTTFVIRVAPDEFGTSKFIATLDEYCGALDSDTAIVGHGDTPTLAAIDLLEMKLDEGE